MRRPLILLAAGALCLLAAGPEALGRLALRADLPGASLLLSDPAALGLARYRAGDYAGADAALAEAGRGQTFNRALTLAATGRHELSVAYLDAVLFASPGDAEAARLRDLVDAMVPKVRGDSVAPGGWRAPAVSGRGRRRGRLREHAGPGVEETDRGPRLRRLGRLDRHDHGRPRRVLEAAARARIRAAGGPRPRQAGGG